MSPCPQLLANHSRRQREGSAPSTEFFYRRKHGVWRVQRRLAGDSLGAAERGQARGTGTELAPERKTCWQVGERRERAARGKEHVPKQKIA